MIDGHCSREREDPGSEFGESLGFHVESCRQMLRCAWKSSYTWLLLLSNLTSVCVAVITFSMYLGQRQWGLTIFRCSLNLLNCGNSLYVYLCPFKLFGWSRKGVTTKFRLAWHLWPSQFESYIYGLKLFLLNVTQTKFTPRCYELWQAAKQQELTAQKKAACSPTSRKLFLLILCWDWLMVVWVG